LSNQHQRLSVSLDHISSKHLNQMDFDNFLSVVTTSEWWRSAKSYCFIGQEYPLLWFSLLFTKLNRDHILPAPYQRIFFTNDEKKTIQATLSQSILGNFSFFWFGNLAEEKETKSTQEFFASLYQYQGPHTIAFFVTKPPKATTKNIVIITLPTELTPPQADSLVRLLAPNLDAKKKLFLKKACSSPSSLDLDTCCMLINYLELTGSKRLEDYEAFLLSIIGSTPSLSLLAEYFFARNTKSFFSVWSIIGKEYPDIFWIMFWSEQLWKAHHVIGYLTNKNFVAAKRMSFRLPYSFMNRDWQKTHTKELARAYEFLYHMDYALKTGSTFCALDLFYLNYFIGKFA
jgi:hypothetical protein